MRLLRRVRWAVMAALVPDLDVPVPYRPTWWGRVECEARSIEGTR